MESRGGAGPAIKGEDGVAASRHSQHRGEEPAGAGTLAPVAAKAAAINAARHTR